MDKITLKKILPFDVGNKIAQFSGMIYSREIYKSLITNYVGHADPSTNAWHVFEACGDRVQNGIISLYVGQGLSVRNRELPKELKANIKTTLHSLAANNLLAADFYGAIKLIFRNSLLYKVEV